MTAHEFFHLWNVKRIRPAVLGPFDYDREVHTSMLWFSEGFTSYYAALILSRAGLVDEKATLASMARRIDAVESRPGHRMLSVAQSSWETWARPDDYDNAGYSYYDKGMLIGMLLDLHLRKVSKGQRSTDTVFRELWQRWRDTGLGLTPEELEQVFIEQAGPSDQGEMHSIFRGYVYGTVAVDYDHYLAHAGLRLDRSIEDPGPWIEAKMRWDGDHMIFDSVTVGGPADRGGIGNGDALIAIDGHAVTEGSYERQLRALEIGESATFEVTRLGRTIELEVVPVEGGPERFEIVELDDVSAEQMVLRRAWLGLTD